MSDQQHNPRIDALFEQSRDLPLDQQRQFLDAHISEDEATLRDQLEALLAAHRNAPKGDFENPLLPRDAIVRGLHTAEERSTTQVHVAERPGVQIGPYKLLEQIGEGGMGVVFMAEQTAPVERRVALKVIKPGMDTGHVVARFEAERQALALMDHPNVARVLDAGTTDAGRPYFVMELVKGVPITQYCDEHRLTAQERLELFIVVCQAVAHAHQKGIIHRDLKPSNVLIAEYDDEAVPKIIDFGVAKATSRKLTDKTLFTHYGQIVGTLDYMSPEQAKLNQLDIDTRSDIYSLGVLLYELLAGTTPFDPQRLRSAAFDEILRIIRHEEPPKPSTRLSGSAALPAVATTRKTEPHKLTQLMRGDLDWIVMKALAKERDERYQTAPSFAADIRRHLDDQPIGARRPSAVGLARRFVRRNRVPVALVLCALLAIAAAGTLGVIALIGRNRQLLAENSNRVAVENAELARLGQQSAVRTENVTRLAKASQFYRDRKPILGLLLAIEAAELNRRHEDQVLPVAHEALLNATQDLGGQPISSPDWLVADVKIGGSRLAALGDNEVRTWLLELNGLSSTPRMLKIDGEQIKCIALSIDGRWLFTGGTQLIRWDLDAENKPVSHVVLMNDVNIVHMQIADDGSRLITQSSDATIQQFKLGAEGLVTFRILDQLTIPTYGEARIAVSPNGRWAAVRDNSVAYLWDLDADRLERTTLAQLQDPSKIWCLDFSRDSRLLLCGGSDGGVRILNLKSDDPTSTKHFARAKGNGNQGIGFGAFSADSRWLFTGSVHSLVIRRWDPHLYDMESSMFDIRGHKDGVYSLRMTFDGQRLVSSSRDGTVRFWDIETDASPVQSLVLDGHDRQVNITALDPSGRWLATVGHDGTARLWDLNAESPASSPLILRDDPDESFTSSAVSSDGRWIATGKRNNSIRLWETSQYGRLKATSLKGHESAISHVAFSPNDRWLASSSIDASTLLWDMKSADIESSRRILNDSASSNFESIEFVFDGTSHFLATTDDTCNILLFDLQSPDGLSSPLRLRGHTLPVREMAASCDGRWLASGTSQGGGSNGQVMIWDLQADDIEASSIRLSPGPGAVSDLAFARTGQLLAAADHGVDGATWVWDLTSQSPAESPRVIHAIPLIAGIWQMAFDPNGRWLFTARYDETGQLWDLDDDNPKPVELPRHDGLQASAISPNGCWLAGGNRSGDTFLWDLSVPDPAVSGRILTVHDEPIWDLKFSADSRWLVTDSSDGTIRRWDLDIDALLNYARAAAGRGFTSEEIEQYRIEP